MTRTNLEIPEIVREAVTKSLQDLLPTLLQPSQASVKKAKEYLNVSEAADYTRLAKQTLYQMTSNRTIPHIKKGGKLIFKRTEIDQWLNAGEVLTLTRCAI